MNMAGGPRTHVRIVILVTVLTGIFRVGLLPRHVAEIRRIGEEAATARSGDIQAYWRTFTYADVSQGSIATEVVARIDSGSLGLSELQVAKLRARVSEVLQYLRDPTFDEYYRLKTEGLHYRFEMNTNTQSMLRALGFGQRLGEATTTKDAVKLVWEATHSMTKGIPSAISGICLKDIAVAVPATNSPWALLGGKVRKGFTRAGETLNPGFHYAEEEAGRGNATHGVRFVHMSFFAKAADSENVGPVYLSLCWLPGDEDWALSRMIADEWLGVRTLF